MPHGSVFEINISDSLASRAGKLEIFTGPNLFDTGPVFSSLTLVPCPCISKKLSYFHLDYTLFVQSMGMDASVCVFVQKNRKCVT